MPALPGFILKRLYVKGTLANSAEGCEFAILNQIGSGTLTRILGVEVDGAAHPVEKLSIIRADGSARPGPGLTPETPLAVAAGAAVTFRLDGLRLAKGQHAVSIGLLTREMGEVDIPFRDAVGEKRAVVSVAAAGPGDPPPVARPVRIAIIGAGSAVFARQLMADFLTTPGLESGTFVLVDVDAERLRLARRIGERMAAASGRPWRVEATGTLSRALPGCHYVISTIEVAGLRSVRPDYEIPLSFGVDQCIGDTIGPGGIFKMLRTGPAWLAILREIERRCPNALVMNYSNPMSAMTLLALRATRLRVVGLCHSVPITVRQLAGYLEVPCEELAWKCAGINHLAWFTELTHRGMDMYPVLRERAEDPEVWEADPVRFEVLKHFGAFVTESSGHLSEYVPYFRKRPDLAAKYTRGGYRGESGYYARNWPAWRQGGDDSIREILDGRSPLTLQRSEEYASAIVEGIECGSARVIHGNTLNEGLIDNLPAGGCVEVPMLADPGGLRPVRFGPLPVQMAALDAAHVPVHELLVAAVLGRDRHAARHALLLDPLTAAVCSPDEIEAMFDRMWAAERKDLGWFAPRGRAS